MTRVQVPPTVADRLAAIAPGAAAGVALARWPLGMVAP